MSNTRDRYISIICVLGFGLLLVGTVLFFLSGSAQAAKIGEGETTVALSTIEKSLTHLQVLEPVVIQPMAPQASSATLTVCKEGEPTCGFDSVQAAIDAASNGDLIKVAEGVYTENLIISKTVTFEGGYESLGWTRNVSIHETVINGSANQTVIGDWDGDQLGVPTVISDTDRYRIWYEGYNDGTSEYSLGMAESQDGISWTKYIGNPVLTPTNDLRDWDGLYRTHVAVLKEGGVYEMWYSGAVWPPDWQPWQTGYATSTNGIDWNIYPGNPVLPVGDLGNWDEWEAANPTVIKDDSIYKMWYHSCSGDNTICSIGYATSTNGIDWAKYGGNPVLLGDNGAWDENKVTQPSVLKDGSTYKMWYNADGKIGYATSLDGIQWVKHPGNPVLETDWLGRAVFGPSVLMDGAAYKMWYRTDGPDYQIGYAESTDGVDWVHHANNPAINPGAPTIWGQPVATFAAGSDGATLDGFTITGGDVFLGGGLYISNGGTAFIDNALITGNAALAYGGGVFIDNADVTIRNSEISSNVVSVGEGGGIGVDYIDGLAHLTLESSIIQNNTADMNGGGIHLWHASATVVDSTFINNTTTYKGGGMRVNSSSTAQITNTVFFSNTVTSGGGGGLSVNFSSEVTAFNVQFLENLATNGGGGITVDEDSKIKIDEGLFVRNTTYVNGGGINAADDVTIENSTFRENTANNYGGGVSLTQSNATLSNNIIAQNHSGSGGNAIYTQDTTAQLLHNTIAQNTGNGRGIFLDQNSDLIFANTIIVSHTTGIHVSTGSTTTLDGTLWGSGAWANGTDWVSDDDAISTGTVNIWDDPAFVDPNNGDYHILNTSAAVDAGISVNITEDIDGDSRPYDSGYDIGADEIGFCDFVTDIPKDECRALVALYNNTNGDTWNNKDGWLVTNTPCSWFGVACSPGHVYSLNLEDNNLSGSIPTEFADLTNLVALTIDTNNLTGPLPIELASLPMLEWAWLSGNLFTGTIPVEYGEMPNLLILSLSGNHINGEIPTQLGNLSNLQRLDLGNNNLTGTIPAELGDLTQLQYLDLHFNPNITGTLPATLQNLSQLQELRIYGTHISGAIPDWLGDFSELRYLQLCCNNLTGTLPASLGNLTNLEYLNLSENPLTGTLPVDYRYLTNLDTLILFENNLSGSIPPEYGEMASLRLLILYSNYLTGNIPASIGDLSQLEWLFLMFNDLSGSLPPELGQLTNLTSMSIYNNHFTGTIPTEYGSLPNLTMLGLENNQLEGPIPSELGNLSSVEVVLLGGNRLEGDVPMSVTNLVNVSVFGIDYNKLTATDPAVVTFLDDKNPGWSSTQTVPPTDLALTGNLTTGLDISWTPISYTQDGGYYEVQLAMQPDGEFITRSDTMTKTADAYAVDGLLPNTTYYIRLRTFTPMHDEQQNDLWSDFSAVISGTTTAAGTQASILPNEDTTLIYTDTEGTETTIEIPTNAVTEEVTIAYIPVSTATESTGFIFAGQAFELNAYQDGLKLEDFTFQKPVTITLEYTDTDVAGLDENTLSLNYWDEDTSTWIDAATTCSPISKYGRHPGENWLAVPICHLSTFGLFGSELNLIYLPIIIKQ